MSNNFANFFNFSISSDHEYEPIEPPPGLATVIGPPVLQITESEHIGSTNDTTTKTPDQNTLGVAQKSVMRSMEFDANEELCIEKMQKDIEDHLCEDEPIETEQMGDGDEVEAEPKKSFFSEVSTRTKNVSHKLSTQASHLRTKLKRTKKPKVESPKSSPRNSLRMSPTEQKKFSRKLKNIHMPKIGKPEFKRPEFTKFKKSDFKLPDFPKVPAKLRLKRSDSLKESPAPTEVTEESSEVTVPAGDGSDLAATTTTIKEAGNKKRFEYPKFLERFRRQSREESTVDSRGSRPEPEDEEPLPSEVHTMPRVSKATRARNFITSRWARKSSEASFTDTESGKYQRYNSETGSMERIGTKEQRLRAAQKDSMQSQDEDVEPPVGSLQTEEQKQLADYDEENRAIHEISEARKEEFERRKPCLMHQESDIVSDEQEADFDWRECERLRESLVAQRTNDLSAGCSERTDPPTEHFGSNESNVETQSSGSSSRRRRTGVIEEIDDDEFYLRSKGISQDRDYIRDDNGETSPNTLSRMDSYDRYYDENFNISGSNRSADVESDATPRKPKRFAKTGFNKSFESDELSQGLDSRQSFDDPQDYYRPDPLKPQRRARKRFDSQLSDEVPVATEYYPPYDEDDNSFYENEHMEGIEQPEILVTSAQKDNLEYDGSLNEDLPSLARQATPPTPPKAPKRKKKSRSSLGRGESIEGRFKGRSNSLDQNGNKEEVNFLFVFRVISYRFLHLIRYRKSYFCRSLSIAPNTII